MYRIFLFWGLLLGLIACSDNNKSGNFRIEGQIEGIKGRKIILIVENPSLPEGYFIDSLVLTKDNFLFTGNVDTIRVAALVIDNTTQVGTDNSSSSSMPVQFFVEPEKTITIEGKADMLHMARLKGSLMNEQLDSLNLFLWEKQLRFDNYVDAYQNAQLQGTEDISTRDSLKKAFVELVNEYKRFVILHNDWDVAPFIISNYLSQYAEFAEIKELFNNLSDRVKNTHYGKVLKEYFGTQASDENFEIAPNFVLFDMNNNEVKLSDFKGRYLVISFWGSWCTPCRESHPKFVKIISEYRKKGLQVLGIAADKDRDAWLKAIKEDKLDWQQVNALEQTHIDILTLYSIRAFPSRVVIDPEGRIISRFVGDDPKFYEFLQNVYQ